MSLLRWIGPILELLALTGLLLNHRASEVRSLLALLTVLLATDSLLLSCATCNTWALWVVKELLHAALFAVVGLEIAARVIVEQRARRAAWRWSVAVGLMAIVLMLLAPSRAPVVELIPRLMGALAWLYTGLAVVMLRYDVRVTPLQDAVLTGFTPYLIVYAATWNHVEHDTGLANVVNPVMFVAALIVVLRAAWQDEARRRPAWLSRVYLRRRAHSAKGQGRDVLEGAPTATLL